MSVTFTDLFCGAGGSSIGLTAAGLELKLAANHWARAIETHAANFPAAEHLCADINFYDMRRLPRTDVLWASPICTEASPAGGTRRPTGQGDLLQELGHISKAGFERTRATFHDVIRAAELHRYKAVLVENVPEVARWELFDWWCQGLQQLGYRLQFVSASSAHIGATDNPHAPQWRDRLYIVATATGIPLPDVSVRPLSWCLVCGEDVLAVQVWKNPRARHIGKYRRQYHFLCPNTMCRNSVVEPYVLPAAAAIDWADLGMRIGDRSAPLADKTMARIRAGLSMFAERPTMITVNHAGHEGRPRPADAAPLPSQTVRIGDGLVSPPMLVPAGGAWNQDPARVDAPMRTRTAREAEALVVPEPFIAVLRNHGSAHSIREPLRTMAAGGHHHALVIPYRRGKRPTTTGTPLHTRDSGALVQPAIAVEDCRFRMLKPREQLRAQRFPDTYTVTGNIGEQTKQAGNAVSANVAQWLGTQITAALDNRPGQTEEGHLR